MIVHGRNDFRRPLVPWGEKVQFIQGGHKAKPGLASKFTEGIFLALSEVSDEYLVGTPDGVVKTATVKRMTLAQA